MPRITKDKSLAAQRAARALTVAEDKVPQAMVVFNSLSDVQQRAYCVTALMRYHKGETLEALSQECGLPKAALLSAVVKFAPEEWKYVQTGRALKERMDAEQCLKTCEPGNVRREEVRLKAAQWELERMAKDVYDTAGRASGMAHIHLHITPLRDNSPIIEIKPGEAE